MDSGFPEFSLPDFLALHPDAGAVRGAAQAWPAGTDPPAVASPPAPSPQPPRPQEQGRGDDLAPPPALQRPGPSPGHLTRRLLELVQAEAEVRHYISQHRIAEMELRSSAFASSLPRSAALCVAEAPFCFYACPRPAAVCAGGEAATFSGGGGWGLTHPPSTGGDENGGASPTPRGSVQWGEEDHNHPLPTPPQGAAPTAGLQKNGGEGDHNHPLPTPPQSAARTTGCQ